MKKLALLFNALLSAFLLMAVVADGLPHDESLALLVLAMLCTSATTLLAFRSHVFGESSEDAPSEARDYVAASSARRRETTGAHKPLYEWLDSVEERLDRVERAHVKDDVSES